MNLKQTGDTGVLSSIREKALYRSMRNVETGAGPWICIEGRRVLHLCSNNYLGLSVHPRVAGLAERYIENFGVGTGASRLISGNFTVHGLLEERLAAWKGKSKALLFPSGYMANVGVISALAGEGDAIFSDRLNHASIVDGCRLSRAKVFVYPHADTECLDEMLSRASGFRRRLIVTDGVFSMDGEIAPLGRLVELKGKHSARLIVDDAHGTGVVGERGAGSPSVFGVEDEVDVVVGTLSKALGSQGGFAAADGETVELLVNTSRPFIYSTGLAVPCAAAALAAVEIIREEFGTLERAWRRSASRLRLGLRAMGFNAGGAETPIVPVIVGDSRAALTFSAELFRRGVYAPAIRPPSVPDGTARIRVTVMASHTGDDVGFALDVFGEAGKAAGVIR
ncbi:MAG: 8-amino-7-oxononanoate synthase [bacterium]